MNAAQFRRLQVKALRPLQRLLRAVLHQQGVPVTPPQATDVAMRLWRPVLTSRQENYRAALAYIDTVQLPSRIVVPTPKPYQLSTLVKTVEAVAAEVRIEGEPITEDNRRDVRVIEEVRLAIEGPVTRLALEAAREPVQEIGETEEWENVGWARVLVGAYSCSFCAMLASRGPVYTSRETAIGRGGNPLNAYHVPYPNKNGKVVGGVCDCVAVLVTSYTKWEGRAAWEALETLWENSGGKHSNKAARLAFRRVWDKKVRDGDTGQYLPDSIKPPRAA